MSECPYCAQLLPRNFDKNELKKFRQRKAMLALAASGIKIGRPVKCDNYKLVTKLRNEGKTLREIAVMLQVSTATIYRVSKGRS